MFLLVLGVLLQRDSFPEQINEDNNYAWHELTGWRRKLQDDKFCNLKWLDEADLQWAYFEIMHANMK
jgi:hypothetical protein